MKTCIDYCDEIVRDFTERYDLENISHTVEFDVGPQDSRIATLCMYHKDNKFSIPVYERPDGSDTFYIYSGKAFLRTAFDLEDNTQLFREFLDAMGKNSSEWHRWLDSGCFQYNDYDWDSN